MKQKLTQKQIQKLAPLQLILARLSQLSQTDLEHAVLEEIEKNPLLELDDDAQNDQETTEQDRVWESDGTEIVRAPRGGFDIMDITQAEEPDFFDILLKQAKESGLEEKEIMIAEQIIGSLDENGFLSGIPIENIAYKLSVEPEEAEKVLKKIQNLGPSGVAARDLKECLLIQLRANHEEPFVIEIIERYFTDYINGDLEKIRKELDLSDEDLRYAVEQISGLNPKPAAGHGEFMKKSIIPDVLLRQKDGKFYVALNETGTPAVRLSATYLKMLDKALLEFTQAGSRMVYLGDRTKKAIYHSCCTIYCSKTAGIPERKERPSVTNGYERRRTRYGAGYFDRVKSRERKVYANIHRDL